MPPKRKRVDANADSTPTTTARATRSSGKIIADDESKESSSSKAKKATTTKASSGKAGSNSNAVVIPSSDEDGGAKPNQKKSRTTKSTQTKSKPKATKGKSNANEPDDDVNEDETGPNVKDALKPYSPSLALSLFDVYADPDTTTSSEPVIGPEGFEKLCNDAQISLDGALPLVMAWMLDAKEMGKIGKDEWVKGMGKLQISSLYALALATRDLESIILLDKKPLNSPPSNLSVGKKSTGKIKEKETEKDPYNRDQYWNYAADTKAAFLGFYGFCFALAKQPQARNIDMETATAFWTVLLMPRYPIIEDIVEFIKEKGTYKGANKDLWSMMLEFCQSVNPNLEDYEADGAWPTLLDDFVLWKKKQTTTKHNDAQADDA